MVGDLSGLEPDEMDSDANLFHMGLDSLMLMKVRQAVEDRFDVRIEMGRFYDRTDTLGKLAGHISERMPHEAVVSLTADAMSESGRSSEPPAEPSELSELPEVTQTEGDGSLERLMALQMQAISEQNRLISRQLEVLKNRRPSLPESLRDRAMRDKPETGGKSEINRRYRAHAGNRGTERRPSPTVAHQGPSDRQKAFLQDFVVRYNARTKLSKKAADRDRPVLSDWIAALGFVMPLKEIVYPVVADRSAGSRMWDIDGNEYVDIAMGYGAHFLGHNPPFVTRAVERQLKRGVHLGPQSDLAGHVAKAICEMTGVERVTFTNSGTEAVMGALRIARCVTGREKVVMFENAFHGTFDGTLAIPGRDGSVPAAPGVPHHLRGGHRGLCRSVPGGGCPISAQEALPGPHRLASDAGCGGGPRILAGGAGGLRRAHAPGHRGIP